MKKDEGGYPHRFLAPGARTLRRCSLDGRSRTDSGHPPKESEKRITEAVRKAAADESTGGVASLPAHPELPRQLVSQVGYVEEAFDARTTLQDFFNSLLQLLDNLAHRFIWPDPFFVDGAGPIIEPEGSFNRVQFHHIGRLP